MAIFVGATSHFALTFGSRSQWGVDMGLLAKLFGGDSSTDARHDATSAQQWQMVRLAGDGRVSVVGESHYQPALRAAAGGRTVARGDFESAIPVQAVLIPEPSNRYDDHAVRVEVNGNTVGYLPREAAEEYQPVLLNLVQQGQLGWCSARVMDGDHGLYGIWLHLASPDRVICANLAEDLEIVAADRDVTVTGEENHQDVLRQVLGTNRAVSAFASFAPCSITKGKYAGEEGLEVRINGQRVGELTKAMSDRYGALVQALTDAGRRPGCEAVIRSSDRGCEVSLRMPKV